MTTLNPPEPTQERKRCPKHEPTSVGNLIEQLRGDVVCTNCGRKGRRSNGDRKYGRPARILWERIA